LERPYFGQHRDLVATQPDAARQIVDRRELPAGRRLRAPLMRTNVAEASSVALLGIEGIITAAFGAHL
jgi:hypothetical protein